MSENIIKLLLVEDNRALAHLMGTMLGRVRNISFRCQSAGSIAEATALLPTGDFDAVLLDLELPDSNGLLSLDRVNAVRPDLPVVVLTAREEEEMALKALRTGAQDYLIKGAVDRRHLVRALLYAVERKRGEDARARLAAIINSSPDAIIGMTLDGRIMSWNHGAELIFGHSTEEAVGKFINILDAPCHENVFAQRLKPLTAGDYVKNFETQGRRKSGDAIHLAVGLSPIHNDVGKIIGASLTARNIEDRKRAEREQDEMIARLHTALADLKALSALIPLCPSCKQVRQDDEYTKQVEGFLQKHPECKDTPRPCPKCSGEKK
jgi:PAS domain S-box-containing protein